MSGSTELEYASADRGGRASSRPIALLMLLALLLLFFGTGSAKGEIAPVAAQKVNSEELAAYQAAFGGSKVIAEERLSVQHRGRMIVDRLEQALGSRYAGVWFDQSKGRFILPLLPRSERSAAVGELAALGLASDYATVPARFSWATLEAEQREIDASMLDLIRKHSLAPVSVRTSLDPATNKVEVEIAGDLSDGERALIEELTRGREAVELRESPLQSLQARLLGCSNAYCGTPLRGGVEINNSSAACTAGFRALGSNGKRYLLTAGHCIQETPEKQPRWQWFSTNSDTGQTWLEIGSADQWQSLGQGDWAKINATGSRWDTASWPAAVVYWGGNAEPKKALNELQPIVAEASSYLGETVCHSGATTGTTCGSVTGLNVTIQSEAGTNYGETEVNGQNLCAGPGDSGGPVFTGSTALGLVTAGTGFFCNTEFFGAVAVFYAEIKKATSALEVKVAPVTPLSSQTTLNISHPSAGVFRASGTVKHESVPIQANQVNVNFYHSENGQWVLRNTAQASVVNGAYQVPDVSTNEGAWRITASFPGNEMFRASEASQEFCYSQPAVGTGSNLWTARRCNGDIDTFFRQSNGNLGHLFYNQSSGWAYESLSAIMGSAPHGGYRSNGDIDTFFRQSNGNLGHLFYNQSSGWAYESLSAIMAGEPQVSYRSNGDIDTFFRQSNGNLGHLFYNQSSGWAYESLSAIMASRPPLATTGGASAISKTTATISGTVNPEHMPTTYYFEYGPTTAYGTKTPVAGKDAGSAGYDAAVSHTLTGLSKGTTYHYRLVAASSEGTTTGADRTFQTPSLVPPVTEPFDGSSGSSSNFSSRWSTLGWAAGSTPKGEDTTAGWGAGGGFPTLNGAFYNPASFDTGTSTLAAVTMARSPGSSERYFSLLLDMPTPSATRAGYELRFTYVSANTYNVTLSKWQAGIQTVLATKSGYAFENGNSLAIVDEGGTVSAWTRTTGSFAQLLSITDSAFSGGNAGILGAGSTTRLTNFGTEPSLYHLVVKHSSKCMDVESESTSPGAAIQQWGCGSASQNYNQQFNLVPISPPYYQVIARHSGQCLDVPNASTSPGAKLQQWTCLGAGQTNQLWKLESMGGGYYELIAKHSGLCADVNGVSQESGAKLQQWTCLGAGQTNQLWKLEPVG